MMNTFYVREIIGSDLGVSFEDGEKVYSEIKKEIKINGKVALSFKGIYIVTSAFLNAVFGLIPKEFEKSQISDLIEFEEISEDDRKIVNMVIENTHKYYQNPEAYAAAFENMLES